MWKALALASAAALASLSIAAYNIPARPAAVILSQSAEPEECISLAAMKADLDLKDIPYTEYTGQDAKGIVATLVAILGEPPSDAYLLADPLVVAPFQGRVYVGFVVNGCYIGRAILSPEVWKEILGNGRSA